MKRLFNYPLFIVFFSLFFLILNMTPAQAGASMDKKKWQISVEPYGMMTSIEGDSKVGRTRGTSVDIDFSDILDVLDAGAMVHMEVFYKDSWGLILDYGFMSLGDDISGPLGGIISAKAEQSVFEGFIAKRFQMATGMADLFTGIRAWDNEVKVRVSPSFWPGTASFDIKESWIDFVIGARYFLPMAEKWTLMLRGDVGGLGLESDFTGTLDARIMYDFNEHISLDVGYKALWVDYENGTEDTKGHFVYDTVTHGPLIGLIFRF